MSEWKEVQGQSLAPFFKFTKVGEELKGKLVGTRTVAGFLDPKTGERKQEQVYDFETPTGPLTVSGSNKDLGTKLAQVAMNSLVHITFSGKKKIEGQVQPLKLYTVKVA